MRTLCVGYFNIIFVCVCVWYLWQNLKFLSFAQERFVLGDVLYIKHCVLLKSFLLNTNCDNILCNGV